MDRHLDWLRQSENDLAWARHSLEGGFFSQTCFGAQQASEKALKALCFSRGYDVVRTHSLFRCPDAFPAGAPAEIITADQAGRALEAAREIFTIVRNRLPDEAETS
jgi:HEPN domain-containing protein